MYKPEEVRHWFTKLEGEDPSQAAKFKRLHDLGREMAVELATILPDRHESVNALDHLQETIGWAERAIARGDSASGVEPCQRVEDMVDREAFFRP